MKTLFKIIAIILPMLMFSQKTDSLEIRQTAEQIIKDQKSIDSLKNLKEKEVKKQLVLLDKIRLKVEKLKTQKTIKKDTNYQIASELEALNALKPNHEVIYWEEIPRKWTGRLFSGEETKVRLFKFEDGKKVYLN